MDKEDSPESNESDSEEAAVDQEKAMAEKEKVKCEKWQRRESTTYSWSRFYFYYQGNAFFKDGKYNDAIECYTRGMSADPYNPVLPTNRATTFFRLKK